MRVSEAVAGGLLEAGVLPGHALDVLPAGQGEVAGGVKVQLLGVTVTVGVTVAEAVTVVLLARHLE